MRTLLLTVVILAAGGCAGPPGRTPSLQSPSSSETAAPETAAPTVSTPVVSTPAVSTSPTFPLRDETAPQGLLVQIRAVSHPGYDRLVLEFGGKTPPSHQMRYVDEVRNDPTYDLISLSGKRYLLIVFDGGTLDTTRWEGVSKAHRYAGPNRIAPDLATLKEVVISGDFEAVLSIAVGLSDETNMQIQELTSPARLVIDFRS